MARSKKTRRPTRETLREALDDALGALYEVPTDKTAQASIDHAVAMIRVWTLRYQIANLDLDEASAPAEGETDAVIRASKAHSARTAAREASVQVAEWEKRKAVAKDDLINDMLIAEKEHTAEQDAIAEAASSLH